MSSWRASSYDNAEQQIADSHPATGAEAGNGFTMQTDQGSLAPDDRLSWLSSGSPEGMVNAQGDSSNLGAELTNTGQQAVGDGPTIAWNPTQRTSHITSLRVEDSAAINIEQFFDDGTWYTTEDEHAGFPLPREPDNVYAARTNDVAGGGVNVPFPFTIEPGLHLVAEKILVTDVRASEALTTFQVPYPGWGQTTGQNPFTGEKDAMPRPLVSQPLANLDPISNAIPSPGGSAGVYPMDTPTTKPLTWRTAPEPWDTSDPSYIDSGV